MVLIVMLAACSQESDSDNLQSGLEPPADATASMQADAFTAEAEEAASAELEDRIEFAEAAAMLEATQQPWFGDFDEMLKLGRIRVAISYGLSSYFLDGHDAKGITYERVHQFEKALRKKFGKQAQRLTILYLPTSRDRLLPMLEEGLADIAASNLTINESRAERVLFSQPFRNNEREVFVTGPAAGSISRAEDLIGTEIYVNPTASFYMHLSALNAERAAAGQATFNLVQGDSTLNAEDYLDLVSKGVLPATVADEAIADFFAQVLDGLTVLRDPPVEDQQKIAWAVRRDAPALLEEVNAFVKTAKKGSLLGNVILNRYTKSTEWINNVLEPDDRDRYEENLALLKKYSEQYGFDWMMISAQAYQESKIDQNRRSHAGAIGIMQIMPRTASDENINIPNIEDKENNVHAGVKYLAFLRERYFSDPSLSDLDRTLFSLAAYNAGPANIRKARKHAAKMGLNPNVWMNNVEIAAGSVISREPVTYVRNISKYYVAYSMIERERFRANDG